MIHIFNSPIAFEDGWLYRFPNGELMFLLKHGAVIRYTIMQDEEESEK
jgi:hypothetical protein